MSDNEDISKDTKYLELIFQGDYNKNRLIPGTSLNWKSELKSAIVIKELEKFLEEDLKIFDNVFRSWQQWEK